GNCVGCIMDSDCGVNDACATHTCLGGMCTGTDTPAGTGNPAGQVAGNCQKLVCNGLGGTMSIADDSNLPTSTNPCVTTGCSGGVPSQASAPSGAPCGTGLECDGVGNCVGCLRDSDCGVSTCVTHTCQAGMCITGNAPAGTADPFGQVAGNCQKVLCDGNGGTTSVPDDTNVPTYANPCAFGSCSGGVPGSEQFHPNGTSCGAGEVCYGIDCLTGCYINGIYRSSGADEPGNTCQVCNPSVSTTAYVFVTDGTTCNDGNDCTTGDHCTSGVCGGTVSADGTACDQGNTCKSGAKQCASGVCNDTSL